MFARNSDLVWVAPSAASFAARSCSSERFRSVMSCALTTHEYSGNVDQIRPGCLDRAPGVVAAPEPEFQRAHRLPRSRSAPGRQHRLDVVRVDEFDQGPNTDQLFRAVAERALDGWRDVGDATTPIQHDGEIRHVLQQQSEALFVLA